MEKISIFEALSSENGCKCHSLGRQKISGKNSLLLVKFPFVDVLLIPDQSFKKITIKKKKSDFLI